MVKRRKFINPFEGLTLKDLEIKNESGTYLESEMDRIKKADQKGESLAFFKFEGDFFYKGKYHSADVIVPSEYILGSDDSEKKFWIAAIFDVPYGERLDKYVDVELVEDQRWGPVKQALMSELSDAQKELEKQHRVELLKHAEEQDKAKDQGELEYIPLNVTIH